MNELKVFMFNGRLVTDSREVAEMVEKRHSDLIRDIESYKEVMDQNAKLRSDDFFLESAYQAGTGKSYKCFMLTKLGCDMVANKMTVEKGILFTVTFVKKFEAMANFIQSGQRGQTISTKEEFEMQLIGARYASEILRLDTTSNVRMLETVHEQHGVPTSHLPVYVDEEVTLRRK
ncbi:Rha family transcriptional regulator [Sporosarcina limicola]|uniref:Rha family phage regulatory protein n=1 Tax=Sporosarcina limicola TaxID=34101 RepID=A0A927REN3_9BACL|nr:Rha family transcriptional regulator [Sporosarcina limicola]MBE1554762.1 Rha family phage regulatory protein [Sporosarcina limicola]